MHDTGLGVGRATAVGVEFEVAQRSYAFARLMACCRSLGPWSSTSIRTWFGRPAVKSCTCWMGSRASACQSSAMKRSWYSSTINWNGRHASSPNVLVHRAGLKRRWHNSLNCSHVGCP